MVVDKGNIGVRHLQKGVLMYQSNKAAVCPPQVWCRRNHRANAFRVWTHRSRGILLPRETTGDHGKPRETKPPNRVPAEHPLALEDIYRTLEVISRTLPLQRVLHFHGVRGFHSGSPASSVLRRFVRLHSSVGVTRCWAPSRAGACLCVTGVGSLPGRSPV